MSEQPPTLIHQINLYTLSGIYQAFRVLQKYAHTEQASLRSVQHR